MGDRLRRRHLRQRASLSRTHPDATGLSARQGGEYPAGADRSGAPKDLTGLNRYPDRLFADHLVDGAVVVTEIAQHITRVLADAGCRPSDYSLIDFEAGRGLRLPHPSHGRLIELGD